MLIFSKKTQFSKLQIVFLHGMVSIVVRQAQFAPWGNAMCVIKRLIVTDGYRVRKDCTIASCVGFRSDGLEDLALLIICVI